MSTQEAARRLGVTARTLYRFVDEGSLPAYKMGRVLRLKAADVDDFIERSRVAAGQPRAPLPRAEDGHLADRRHRDVGRAERRVARARTRTTSSPPPSSHRPRCSRPPSRRTTWSWRSPLAAEQVDEVRAVRGRSRSPSRDGGSSTGARRRPAAGARGLRGARRGRSTTTSAPTPATARWRHAAAGRAHATTSAPARPGRGARRPARRPRRPPPAASAAAARAAPASCHAAVVEQLHPGVALGHGRDPTRALVVVPHASLPGCRGGGTATPDGRLVMVQAGGAGPGGRAAATRGQGAAARRAAGRRRRSWPWPTRPAAASALTTGWAGGGSLATAPPLRGRGPLVLARRWPRPWPSSTPRASSTGGCAPEHVVLADGDRPLLCGLGRRRPAGRRGRADAGGRRRRPASPWSPTCVGDDRGDAGRRAAGRGGRRPPPAAPPPCAARLAVPGTPADRGRREAPPRRPAGPTGARRSGAWPVAGSRALVAVLGAGLAAVVRDGGGARVPAPAPAPRPAHDHPTTVPGRRRRRRSTSTATAAPSAVAVRAGVVTAGERRWRVGEPGDAGRGGRLGLRRPGHRRRGPAGHRRGVGLRRLGRRPAELTARAGAAAPGAVPPGPSPTGGCRRLEVTTATGDGCCRPRLTSGLQDVAELLRPAGRCSRRRAPGGGRRPRWPAGGPARVSTQAVAVGHDAGRRAARRPSRASGRHAGPGAQRQLERLEPPLGRRRAPRPPPPATRPPATSVQVALGRAHVPPPPARRRGSGRRSRSPGSRPAAQ